MLRRINALRRTNTPRCILGFKGASEVDRSRFTLCSRGTSGLALQQHIQCWSDKLTYLCGQFAIDPLAGINSAKIVPR
jgi:hypothetical protein